MASSREMNIDNNGSSRNSFTSKRNQKRPLETDQPSTNPAESKDKEISVEIDPASDSFGIKKCKSISSHNKDNADEFLGLGVTKQEFFNILTHPDNLQKVNVVNYLHAQIKELFPKMYATCEKPDAELFPDLYDLYTIYEQYIKAKNSDEQQSWGDKYERFISQPEFISFFISTLKDVQITYYLMLAYSEATDTTLCIWCNGMRTLFNKKESGNIVHISCTPEQSHWKRLKLKSFEIFTHDELEGMRFRKRGEALCFLLSEKDYISTLVTKFKIETNTIRAQFLYHDTCPYDGYQAMLDHADELEKLGFTINQIHKIAAASMKKAKLSIEAVLKYTKKLPSRYNLQDITDFGRQPGAAERFQILIDHEKKLENYTIAQIRYKMLHKKSIKSIEEWLNENEATNKMNNDSETESSSSDETDTEKEEKNNVQASSELRVSKKTENRRRAGSNSNHSNQMNIDKEKEETENPIQPETKKTTLDFEFIYDPSDSDLKNKWETEFKIGYIPGDNTKRVFKILPDRKLRDGLGEQVKAFGVFSVNDLRVGEKIGDYTGEIVEETKANDKSYVYVLENNYCIDAINGGNITRFINHSSDPNCKFYQEDDRVFVKTIRHIRKGEQLTIYYGPMYPFEKNIVINPYHSNLSTFEFYQKHKEAYKKWEGPGNVKELLGLQDGDYILKHNRYNDYPVLRVSNHRLCDKQLEITFSHLLLYSYNKKEILEKIDETRINLNIRCDEGRTPLQYLIMRKDLNDQEKSEILFEIIDNFDDEQLINFYSYDINHKTLFHNCIELGLNKCFHVLKNHLKIKEFQGMSSPFISCAKSKNHEILELMIQLYFTGKKELEDYLNQNNIREALIDIIRTMDNDAKRKFTTIFAEAGARLEIPEDARKFKRPAGSCPSSAKPTTRSSYFFQANRVLPKEKCNTEHQLTNKKRL